MRTFAIHSVASPDTQHALLNVLIKVVLALLAAALLGFQLEHLPLEGEGWSLPVDPVIAANFTA